MRTRDLSTRALPLLISIALIACDGPQSSLTPAGRDADRILHLFNVMTMGAIVVWLGMIVVAVYAIRVRESHSYRVASVLVLGGGVALPTAVLAALLVYGLPVLPAVLGLPSDDTLVIHVTGKQWWWRVQYVTPAGAIETANELHLPVGRRVVLQLASDDVIHSFWVPSIAGKMDMIPGRVTRLALEPTRTGVFRGACAEYCGASHARMAFHVVVVEPRQFDSWLDAQARPAASTPDDATSRGQLIFASYGCTACHTVRGLSAASRVGPDLTHVGSRLSIAAGTLPNTHAGFTGWVLETQRHKPGVLMPPFRTLPAEDLVALAAYLDGLQ